jgi:transposase
LLALAEIYDGGSRTKAARIGGVGLQTVRDWVVRFNARGPEGLIDGKAPGNACKLNDRQRQALVNIVESGPMPAIHGVVRWRLKDLAMWIWEEFRISISETTLSRELRSLGYRKLSARPRHSAQNPEALELFKKSLPATLEAIRAGLPKGMCGRPLRCKKNLWTAAALDRVLPCVRPLLRRLTGRGPVWEFVDQVHITEARSKRSPFAWFS